MNPRTSLRLGCACLVATFLAAPARADDQAAEDEREPAAGRFFQDVWGDYRDFFSIETLEWYSTGTVASFIVHPFDEEIRDSLQDPTSLTARSLEGGDTYGNLSFQVPVAVAWWITGHLAHSARAADAGRDLLRAQISALSWTYAAKYIVNRTRPNGDPRSFPSGHTSASFATAMVLQEHYGWKLGLPVFAVAGYTAVSRLTVNKHWASDVMFGAFVGMASGRTVTLHLRGEQLVVHPVATPGGGAVSATITWR